MKDKHNFSKSYINRKEAVLNALNRVEKAEKGCSMRYTSHIPIKVLLSAVILAALTVSAYAAVQWIDFTVEQNGDEVYIHASLNETDENTVSQKKTLRSWRAEDGEISVKLSIPNLPSDMSEDQTANGKYRSEDNSRSMTISGIDLRRSDLDQLIDGAAYVEQLDAGGKEMYVIEKGGADYYNRIAYIVFNEDELVLKLWVSYGITDEELSALASTMTIENTTNALLAIPIQNELSCTTSQDIPFIYINENDPIYEANLIKIGASARDNNDWYTITVNGVNVYDNIGVLNPNYIMCKDFVKRFTDDSGRLIPYNRTDIIYNTNEEANQVTKHFGETVPAKKKLYVVLLTVADITLDNVNETDRKRMVQACVNSYNLSGYTVNDGKLDMICCNAVVDSQPGENACSSEIVYREYIGENQWRVAYLIDEDIASGNLVLNCYTSGISVKIK